MQEPKTEALKVRRMVKFDEIPITALIAAVILIASPVISSWVQFNIYGRDIQTLTKGIEKIELKIDNRDDRIQNLYQSVIRIEGVMNSQDQRISRLEGDVKDFSRKGL